jgi:peptidoglycan/xylan/chitin deacetylase (PgdA/CDA1 family)
MQRWFGDRPALAAVLALAAPLLFSMIGLAVVSALPAARPAALAHLPVSLPTPGFLELQTPSPAPTAAAVDIVPAGLSQVHVPILEYHYIRVNPDPRDRLGFNLSVTPDDFAAQMSWLQTAAYHPIDLTRLRAYFQQRQPLPARAVVLTFDDGYEDFVTAALPVLRAHGFAAVSYVVPGFLGRSGYLTVDQVREIDGDGIEVAAHTLHHVDLTTTSPAGVNLEVQGSRSALEQIVQHPVLDFCYPSGKYNAPVVAATETAGLQSATTEVPGTAHAWADRMTWTRVRVNGGEQLAQFAASLGTADPSQPAPSV